jgi:hypothetical protein
VDESPEKTGNNTDDGSTDDSKDSPDNHSATIPTLISKILQTVQ